ncbi:MAG: hypothetical protein U5O15_02330 [Candidatus Krumholzibacteriota bacterium]|nr:hypothetical protein [Candidatus Krumholzibacteriota bacterium]
MKRYSRLTCKKPNSIRGKKAGLSVLIKVLLIFSSFFPFEYIQAVESDFLIPGISFGDIDFRAGTKIEYIVISEVYEVRDTSLVGLSVIDSPEDKTVLEITSSPWPAAPSEMITVRVTMTENCDSIETLGNLDSILEKVMIKEGDKPFREATEKEIEDFELDRMFIHPEEFKETKLSSVKLKTPAGQFNCELKEFHNKRERKMNLGGNEAVRFEEESNLLWISGEVPFWGLVKSEVTKKTYTRMNLPHTSERTLNVKETFLRSELISFTENKNGNIK